MGMPDSGESQIATPAGSGAACLCIDRVTGDILDCNQPASALLRIDACSLRGMRWSEAICCQADQDTVLAQVLAAGIRSSLPPFLIRRVDDREVVVAGVVLPWEQGSSLTLILWQLLDEEDTGFTITAETSDTVAILGVDQLRYDLSRSVAETRQLMLDVRSSLQSIIRTQDSAALPAGAAIMLILRDVDIDGAMDISRALLSHLHRAHMAPDSAQADARICVGLAHLSDGNTPLSALMAANNALLQAQYSSEERIGVAADEDRKILAGRVLNSCGLFTDSLPDILSALERPREQPVAPSVNQVPLVTPLEKGIEGYVGDNMEGAVDQAIFLARLDIPIAIIGPAGTGKMYIAKIINEESGAAADMLVDIDCREFRSRSEANARIANELARGEGKTLVFKSPHLMNAEAQLKLARQISSRTLADVSPPQYMPRLKLIALFPESLEKLIKQGRLTSQLASAFAGYPIHVPPIKDRKQAVLRWAHKILEQEGLVRARDMKGFTPDAEQAMLLYDWPGNISEMRQCVINAMDKTAKDWLTPVDLGLFKGLTPGGAPYLPESSPFLVMVEENADHGDTYVPSALETLDVALGEAVYNLLTSRSVKPLGAWADDEVVLATLDRYRDDSRRAADFLHTKPRNISRWLPKIQGRDAQRNGNALWQKPRRLLREWIRELPRLPESPQRVVQGLLLAHVDKQCDSISAANRARIIGVSMPTYLKRLREIESG
jgi:DNA-binding NtrC family response regulator